MPTGRSRGVLAALLTLAALLATGCQARLGIDVTLDGDGAGTLAVSLSADAALLEEARSRGLDPLDGLAATGRRLEPSGWAVEDTVQPGGGREVRLSTPFAGPEEFEALAADLSAALAAPEVTLLEDLRLEATPELLHLEGTAGLVPGAAVTDLGLDPGEAVALLADSELFVYEITVRPAGEVVETTGAAEAGEPLRWRVLPGEQARLLVVVERPRADPWPVVAGGAVSGLLALLGLALVRRRRRRRRLRALRARSLAGWR